MTDNLQTVAEQSRSADEFIYSIQDGPDELLSQVYEWERSDPIRASYYKFSGWFRIARDYYELNHKLP